MTYEPRIVDEELIELSSALPAVALEGAKGVGKTATASRRAAKVFALDDPAMLEIVAADPNLLTASGPVLIDEWQRHPPVWDFVRRRVDAGAEPGSFLLTGSAMPIDAPAHSGAGRIVRIRMRPMALSERGLGHPSVSLGQLLSGDRQPLSGATTLSLSDYAREILTSGFPGIRHLPLRARRAQLDGYISQMMDHDFPEQGHRIRRPESLRAWMTAYAAATATTTSYNAILDAATPGESDKPAKATTIAYRDVLSQLWLLDPLPGWVPGRGHMTRLTQAPKHHLADPALAAHLLGVGTDALLEAKSTKSGVARDGPLLGGLFESLVTLSVKGYAQANEATVRHLRTQDSRHEVDLIVERSDHRIVAIEVKLGSVPDGSSVRHLTWLRDQLGDGLLDAAVVTTGAEAYRRRDGIAVIPAALLGP